MQTEQLNEKAFNFAVRVTRLYRALAEEKKDVLVYESFLRSGTTVGALVREMAEREGPSHSDLMKAKHAVHEVKRTLYWLDLLLACELLGPQAHPELKAEAEELLELLAAVVDHIKKSPQQSPPQVGTGEVIATKTSTPDRGVLPGKKKKIPRRKKQPQDKRSNPQGLDRRRPPSPPEEAEKQLERQPKRIPMRELSNYLPDETRITIISGGAHGQKRRR